MSNFKLGSPNIQLNATATANLTASTTRPLTNLFSGSRSDRFELASTSTDTLTINYDLGASTTKTANYLAIMRAKLLHRNDCTGIRLRGSTQSAYTPSSISPTAWFDANRGVTLTSGAVSQWDDQSSGGTYDATQSTAINRPTLSNNAVNGNRSLNFDGSNDTLATTLAVNQTGGMYFYCVINPSAVAATKVLASAWSSTTTNCRFEMFFTATGVVRVNITKDAYNHYIGRYSNAGAITAGQTVVLGFTYDGTTSATGIKIYKNGTQIDTTTASAGAYTVPTAGDPLYLGSNNGSPGTYNYIGYMPEAIFGQGSTLSDPNRQAIEAYLTTKYITTPIVQLDSLSSTTLMGPNSEDYWTTFTESSAFRHWWLEFVNSGTASKYNCSKLFFGKALDLGKEPEWSNENPLDIGLTRRNVWSREAEHSATLNIGPVSDTNISTFISEIANTADVIPIVALDTSQYVFNQHKGMHCSLINHNIKPSFTTENDLEIELKEQI